MSPAWQNVTDMQRYESDVSNILNTRYSMVQQRLDSDNSVPILGHDNFTLVVINWHLIVLVRKSILCCREVLQNEFYVDAASAGIILESRSVGSMNISMVDSIVELDGNTEA